MEDQKVRVERIPYSMFSKTPVYHGISAEVDGKVEKVLVFGLLRDAVVPDPSDFLFTVPPGAKNRLDLISQKFYNTPELWWAIARVNAMIDPLVGPQDGDLIRIPTQQRLSNLGVLL